MIFTVVNGDIKDDVIKRIKSRGFTVRFEDAATPCFMVLEGNAVKCLEFNTITYPEIERLCEYMLPDSFIENLPLSNSSIQRVINAFYVQDKWAITGTTAEILEEILPQYTFNISYTVKGRSISVRDEGFVCEISDVYSLVSFINNYLGGNIEVENRVVLVDKDQTLKCVVKV